MTHRSLGRFALLAALTIVSIACAAGAPSVPGPAMPARDTVVISDSPYAAYVGSPISLGARVWREGAVDPDARVEWSASPLTVARVANDGTLTPVGEGRVTITARVGAVESRRTLLVRRSPTRRTGGR